MQPHREAAEPPATDDGVGEMSAKHFEGGSAASPPAHLGTLESTSAADSICLPPPLLSQPTPLSQPPLQPPAVLQAPPNGLRRSLRVGPSWVAKHAPAVKHLAIGMPSVAAGAVHASRQLRAQVSTPGGSLVERAAIVEYSPPPVDETASAEGRRDDRARWREENAIRRFDVEMAEEEARQRAATERARRAAEKARQAVEQRRDRVRDVVARNVMARLAGTPFAPAPGSDTPTMEASLHDAVAAGILDPELAAQYAWIDEYARAQIDESELPADWVDDLAASMRAVALAQSQPHRDVLAIVSADLIDAEDGDDQELRKGEEVLLHVGSADIEWIGVSRLVPTEPTRLREPEGEVLLRYVRVVCEWPAYLPAPQSLAQALVVLRPWAERPVPAVDLGPFLAGELLSACPFVCSTLLSLCSDAPHALHCQASRRVTRGARLTICVGSATGMATVGSG